MESDRRHRIPALLNATVHPPPSNGWAVDVRRALIGWSAEVRGPNIPALRPVYRWGRTRSRADHRARAYVQREVLAVRRQETAKAHRDIVANLPTRVR